MIPEIVIQESPEYVYNLKSLDIDAELVISDKFKYILTPDNYFPFNSVQDFIEKNNNFILINEDKDIFSIQKDKFEIISDILRNI